MELSIIRKKILQVAIGELGVTEYPMGSNLQKYGEWYGLNGYPWCAMFVSWIFYHAGFLLGFINDQNGYRDCQAALNHFRKLNLIVTDPLPGDLVFHDWNKDHHIDHTSIFMQKRISDPKTFLTIEGNTSFDNNSNGGEVMIRMRKFNQAIFVRPTIYITI